MLTFVGMLVENGYFLYYLLVLWQYMLLFFSNCWVLLDNPVNTPCPVFLPVLCLVCHGMLNN
jgi:hypothetical protein